MGGECKVDFIFFSIVQHASAESQHPEAWPASTYRHLRGVPDNKKLLSGTLPDNKKLFSGTLPDINLFLINNVI